MSSLGALYIHDYFNQESTTRSKKQKIWKESFESTSYKVFYNLVQMKLGFIIEGHLEKSHKLKNTG